MCHAHVTLYATNDKENSFIQQSKYTPVMFIVTSIKHVNVIFCLINLFILDYNLQF